MPQFKCVRPGCEVKAGSHVQTTELYHAYQRWATEHGEEVESQKMLAAELKDHGFSNKPTGHTRSGHWFGLKLKTSQQPESLQQGNINKHKLDEQYHIFDGNLPDELVWSTQEFEEHWDCHPEDHVEANVHGKNVKLPRWNQAYGADYSFSGQTMNGLPVPAFLQPLLDWSRETIHPDLNGLLVNWYDGSQKHYIGQHHDSTKHMVNGAPIVTISFGEERVFRLTKEQGKGKQKRVVDTEDFKARNGGVLVIPFETNLAWKHGVPHFVRFQGKRISVTIRAFRVHE